MKRCPKCTETKPLLEFHNDKSRKDGKRCWCISCCRIQSSEDHEKNLERRKAQKRRYYYDLFDGLVELLGGKCVACGEPAIAVLEIDHIDGDGKQQRLNDGGSTAHFRRMRDSLLSGINGGWQLLCGNCHNRKSYRGRRLGTEAAN